MKKFCIFLMFIFFFIFSNSYSQFVVQNTPATDYLISISSPSNSVAWACGNNHQIIRTTNGGTNWVNALGNLPFGTLFVQVWAMDSLTAHLSATGPGFIDAYIFKTTNGGVSWSQTFFQANGFINGISFKDDLTGFAEGDPVAGRWTLLKTSNGGSSWDSLGMNLPDAFNEFGAARSIFYEGSKIWFGTLNTSKIYSSTNNGISWFSSHISLSSAQSIYFNDAINGKGLATDSYGENDTTIIKTSDGINWLKQNQPNSDIITSLTGLSGSSNYWITKDSGIYRSTNDGNSWSKIYNNLPLSSLPNSICTSRSGSSPRSIYAGRHDGKIIKGDVTSEVITLSSKVPDKFELFQNYPNPFNPTTKINFKIKESGYITLKVFDLQGKEVSTLIDQIMNFGSYSIDFNSNNLSSGIYFYQLSNDLLIESKKMILLK